MDVLSCARSLPSFDLPFSPFLPSTPWRKFNAGPSWRGTGCVRSFVRRASVKVKRRKSGFEDEPSNLLVDVARDGVDENSPLDSFVSSISIEILDFSFGYTEFYDDVSEYVSKNIFSF